MLFRVVDIMAILFGVEVVEDSINWCFESSRFYLVLSGYHLANRIVAKRIPRVEFGN